MSEPGNRWRAGTATIALIVLLGACAPDQPPRAVDQPVHLKDFKIELDRRPLHAGVVVLGIRNAGPTVHELVIARTGLAGDQLPLGKDGLSVDEDAGVAIVDEMEEVQLGAVHDLPVRLPAGHYVLFCNLEGHYLGGMHAELEVGA